jgi:hypothetical protein
MITIVAVVLMLVGLAAVLRAAAVVTTGGGGRFPLDPVVSVLLGFGLMLLGQALLGT